ncbi:PPPDE peptidase domain-containing protein 1 [Fasciola gigantica]|uniref:PPPDE peptidase domain-containing protein 1 n=1 Tax=Fasciola gigantica TaxID=46835 RepID=A0A504Z3P3_FASGI|nr:PPPDE peptidase domain-containing protein 1 [Fasciola gigantica]
MQQRQERHEQQQQHQSLHGFLDKLKAKLDRNGGAGKSGQSSRHSSLFTATGTVVSVNVYDMMWLNVYTNSFGIGVYHTGVVVYGTEYCYGGHPFDYSGIFAMAPQDSETLGPNYSYKTTINMGWTDFTESDISLILEDMGPQYRGDQYHLLHRNCNHFSDAFVQILCGTSLPKWINRLATVGAKLPFVERSIPKIWLTPRPLEELNAAHSERSNTNADLGTCSCPLLLNRDGHPAEQSPSKSRPNPFSRIQSTFQRRLNLSDRPRSSVSFRGLLNRSREIPVDGNGSLMTLADSLDAGLHSHPADSRHLRRSSLRRYSAHPRLRDGDSDVNSRGSRWKHGLAESDSNDPSKLHQGENGIRIDSAVLSSADELCSTVKRRDSIFSRLSVPIPSTFHTRRPSSVHTGSERSGNSGRALSSANSRETMFSTVSPVGASSTGHSIASRRSCTQPLTDLGTAVQDQPIAHNSQPFSEHKSSQHPSITPMIKSQAGTNCAHNLTTGLLTRLQNLCGATQLHDSIHSSPALDSDTNSLTNSAF